MADLHTYVNRANLATFLSKIKELIPSVTGFLTKSDADDTYAKKTDIPDLDDYPTKGDLDGLLVEEIVASGDGNITLTCDGIPVPENRTKAWKIEGSLNTDTILTKSEVSANNDVAMLSRVFALPLATAVSSTSFQPSSETVTKYKTFIDNLESGAPVFCTYNNVVGLYKYTGSGNSYTFDVLVADIRKLKELSTYTEEENEHSGATDVTIDAPDGGSNPSSLQIKGGNIFITSRGASTGNGIVITLQEAGYLYITGGQGAYHNGDKLAGISITNAIIEYLDQVAEYMVSLNEYLLALETACKMIETTLEDYVYPSVGIPTPPIDWPSGAPDPPSDTPDPDESETPPDPPEPDSGDTPPDNPDDDD